MNYTFTVTKEEAFALGYALKSTAASLDELLQQAFTGAVAGANDSPDELLSFLWELRQSRDAMNAVRARVENEGVCN